MNMNLEDLKTHNPAKAEVIGMLFDIVNNELKNPTTYRSSWDKNKAYEILLDVIGGRVYCGACTTSNDDLRHHYETEFWQFTEHMLIEDYCSDVKTLNEWEQIQTRYYQELKRGVLEFYAQEVVKEITDDLEMFYWYLNDLSKKEFWGESDYRETFDNGDYELLALSGDCPHGWQAHTDEIQEEDLYLYRWLHGRVEGLNAISLSMFGGALWATLTIDPKDNRHLEALFTGDF